MSADLPRFFVDGLCLADPAEVEFHGPVCQQMRDVLRLRPGHHVILLDGTGLAREAELLSIGRDQVIARLQSHAPFAPEPAIQVTMCCAVLKGDRQSWMVQKAVELGVWRIQPILSERCVARADGGKSDRWRRIAREAAEQCERAIVPEVGDPIALEEVAWTGERAVICTEREGTPLCQLVGSTDRRLWIFIGPEGGWAPRERHWLAERGAQAASLGPRVLRAETAALAALSLSILAQEGLGQA